MAKAPFCIDSERIVSGAEWRKSLALLPFPGAGSARVNPPIEPSKEPVIWVNLGCPD
jgi:hypothetical protein